MKRIRQYLALAVSLMLMASSATDAADKETEQRYKRGDALYQQHCVGCHGAGGDGKGFERILDSIRPPDFTAGEVRYKSTPAGMPPTSGDLSRTIANGIPRTSMPHHNYFDEAERLAVVTYVSSFFPDWAGFGDEPQPVVLPPRPRYLGSELSARRGEELFVELGCGTCHGVSGDGRGQAGASLPPDSRGLRQRPANLRRAAFKGGGTQEDIYRTVVIGFDGTAMSSYAQRLLGPTGDGWHLAHFVSTLGR